MVDDTNSSQHPETCRR